MEVIALWECGTFKYRSHMINHSVKKLRLSIPHQTLYDWLGKEYDNIKRRRNNNFKKHRLSTFKKLENIVFDYVCSMNNFNGTLTGATLKKASEEVCKWLNEQRGLHEDVLEFQASNGWEYNGLASSLGDFFERQAVLLLRESS